MYNNIYDCEAYACYLKDKEDLSKSTSGGAFFAFAKYVIKMGGVVFGAAFQENFIVHHMSADTLKDLDKLRKSKYVQSRIGDTYIETQTLLEEGRPVLFSGTPCQIAGLKSFLGKENDLLFTVDLICHGVPNNQLLREHMETLENTYGIVDKIQFRDKDNGWSNVSVSYQLENQKKVLRHWEDAYFYGFNNYYFLRPCCYECRFRKMNSGADITIGDYWGIRDEHPDFWNDDEGISAIIIKSEKGKKLFEKCRKAFVYCETTVKKIANYNVWVTGTPGEKRIRKRFYDYWLNGEKDLYKIYEKIENEKSLQFGIIGSYSSRLSVHFLRSYDRRVMIQWQITNSGICSMMSEKKADIDLSDITVSNEYRRQSLKNDIEKRISFKLEEKPAPDYIVIDFLEERFPLLIFDDQTVVTESEAYEEIRNQISVNIKERMTMEQLSEEYWQNCCDSFIAMLQKHYRPEQIILNRLYLVENYGQEEPEHPFKNWEQLRLMNEKLRNYYDYFIKHFPGIYVIDEIDPTTDFCHEYLEHGCEPVYYNRGTMCNIREKMKTIVEDK